MKLSAFKLLCLSGLFAIFSSTISKSPVLPIFAAQLGADPSEVGLVASISSFTGIVASIPAGVLSDRLGRRKILIYSLFVFATAPFFYLFVDKIWQLALVRFYHGFATALFVPVAMAYVADLFTKERGEKIGWFSTSTLLGRFLAPIVGGSILGSALIGQEFNIDMVYLVCGMTGLLALIIAFRLPSESSHEESQKGLPPKKEINSTKVNFSYLFSSLKSVLSNRFILVTAVVEASILFAYGTFETFLPLNSIKNGLNPYEVGILLSAQIITLAFTKPLMGRLSDRYGRPPQILIGALFGVLCIGSFSLFKSFFSLLILSIIFGLSLSIVTSATSAFIADLSKRETRGSSMGILGSVMDIGHTSGPLISGVVASYLGYDKSFIGASIVLLVVALAFMTIVLFHHRSQS